MVVLSCTNYAYPQGEWAFKKEKYGTKAYTRSHPNYSIEEYKVETIIEADIVDIISIMADESSYLRIFQDIIELRFFNQRDDYFEIYLVNEAPFPARDRDGWFISQLSYDPDTKTARVDITCPSSEYHQRKHIEITRCQGHWKFIQLEEGKVSLTQQFIADPGGFVPAFILNIFLVNNPLTTIRDLKKVLKEGSYTRKEFEFLKG